MGGLDAVDSGYGALYEMVCQVCDADGRVRSVAISGSVAAGTADAYSDLDLQVVVFGESYDEFLADWPSWLASITPTVFARTPIAPFIINAVTTEGLTLDIVVYRDEVFEFPPQNEYVVGMLSGVRFADVDDALEYAVAEQLRGMAGPFISLVCREEHLRHMMGAAHLLGLVTTVFLAETRLAPPGKLWNDAFTPEQLAAVAALPSLSATREGVVEFGLGAAKLVVTRARPLFAERGLEWPAELARVAADRVRIHLGVETDDWLY